MAVVDEIVETGEAALSLHDVTEVVIDMGGVTFLDATGISGLVRLHDAAEDRGLPFRVDPAPAKVTRVLAISGLDRVLGVVPDDRSE